MKAPAAVPALPAALAPWAETLALFDPEVWPGMGPWLGPIEWALGRSPAPRDRGHGDPDGYAGLTRRGSYERLLASEWLLAEELPDEFLRRAASREHLFVELARARNVAQPAMVVLFDCGPHQIGAPRLAHLAIVVVLARRARAAGARLLLAPLQSDVEPMPVSVASIRALLDARTARPAGGADLARWSDRLARAELQEAALWIVGAGELRSAAGAQHVAVTESADGSSLELGCRGRRAALPLPPDALAARTLRQPFSTPPGRRRLDTGGDYDPSMQLVAHGRRLLVRIGDDIVALHVPNSPKEPPGSDKRARSRPNEPVVAATFVGKRMLWLGWDGEALWLRDAGGDARRFKGAERVAVGRDGAQLLEMAVDQWWGRRRRASVNDVRRAWLLDAERSVWRLEIDEDGKTDLRRVASDVVAFTAHQTEVAYAYAHGDALRIASSTHGVSQLGGRAGSQVRLGVLHGPPPIVMQAVQVHSGWRVRIGSSGFDFPRAFDHAVVGIAGGASAKLVVVDRGRRTFSLLSPDGEMVCLVQLERAAVALRWSAVSRRLAYRTDRGEIGVFDVGLGEAVLRVEVGR